MLLMPRTLPANLVTDQALCQMSRERLPLEDPLKAPHYTTPLAGAHDPGGRLAGVDRDHPVSTRGDDARPDELPRAVHHGGAPPSSPIHI